MHGEEDCKEMSIIASYHVLQNLRSWTNTQSKWKSSHKLLAYVVDSGTGCGVAGKPQTYMSACKAVISCMFSWPIRLKTSLAKAVEPGVCCLASTSDVGALTASSVIGRYQCFMFTIAIDFSEPVVPGSGSLSWDFSNTNQFPVPFVKVSIRCVLLRHYQL